MLLYYFEYTDYDPLLNSLNRAAKYFSFNVKCTILNSTPKEGSYVYLNIFDPLLYGLVSTNHIADSFIRELRLQCRWRNYFISISPSKLLSEDNCKKLGILEVENLSTLIKSFENESPTFQQKDFLRLKHDQFIDDINSLIHGLNKLERLSNIELIRIKKFCEKYSDKINNTFIEKINNFLFKGADTKKIIQILSEIKIEVLSEK
jgi:hypothetical protein